MITALKSHIYASLTLDIQFSACFYFYINFRRSSWCLCRSRYCSGSRLRCRLLPADHCRCPWPAPVTKWPTQVILTSDYLIHEILSSDWLTQKILTSDWLTQVKPSLNLILATWGLLWLVWRNRSMISGPSILLLKYLQLLSTREL